MNFKDRAIAFDCNGESLYGIASVPEQASRRGVLIVVGGPQYRVGSHRQFALLSRSLAVQGIPVLRFDYRGMGDSDGAARTFEDVNQDLKAAIDKFMAAVPDMSEVVIWGLCDAASAAMFYAGQDARVCGMVLLNPWVRTSGGYAKATLKHYYRDRLLQPALWKKIFTGKFNYGAAAGSFARLLGAASGKKNAAAPADANQPAAVAPLPERMLAGMSAYKGKVLLILSGTDLTAKEFSDVTKGSRPWQKELSSVRVTRRRLEPADHTFSRREWRDQVALWTSDWIKSW